VRRLVFSFALGGFLAVFFLGVFFGALSLFNPGWLRSFLAPLNGPALVTPLRAVTATRPALALDEPGQTPLPLPLPTLPPEPAPDASEPPPPTAVPLPTIPSECSGPETMTIALLGLDTREGDYSRSSRTDAITLVRLNFQQPSAAMLTLPRDLYVALPNLEAQGLYEGRINTAYLYGEVYDVPGGGVSEFKQTIELNFGIRVDRYVMVHFPAFIAAVDALGGVEVDVPKPISDPDFPDGFGGTMLFEMPAGRQLMDGQTALRYVRTRHQDDDYQRGQRQQDVLLALRDRLTRPEVIPQLPALVAALINAGQTDLSPAELAALVCLGPKIERDTIHSLAVDGSMVLDWYTAGGARVSIPNRDLIAPVVAEFLNGGGVVAQQP
jgi:polyisoprenyl-teichoic acid--peptidoglycan teichoic acid transferase